MAGAVSVGGRRIRIANGLLLDPRPEPLLFSHGDGGILYIDEHLHLRFRILRAERRFAIKPRVERRLGIALAVTTAAATCLVAVMQTSDSPPSPPASIKRLTTRPGHIRVSPPPPPPRQSVPVKRTPGVHRRKATARSERATASTRRRRGPRANRRAKDRGVLDALKRASKLNRLLHDANQDVPEVTRTSEQTLTSAAAAPDPTTGPGGGDPLVAALALARAAAGRPGGSLALPELPRDAARSRPRGRLPTGARRPSREAIRKVVARGAGAVRSCYERVLLVTQQPLEGRIMLSWHIDSAGLATDVTVVRDSVGSPGLRACLAARVGEWRFPPCSSRCKVVYPFDFEARKRGEHGQGAVKPRSLGPIEPGRSEKEARTAEKAAARE
jgi:hypothetical protein